MKTVLIYDNTSKDVGDVDHLKIFASEDAAERWFVENDQEGVAFEYQVTRMSAAHAYERGSFWRNRSLSSVHRWRAGHVLPSGNCHSCI
jgi:hypothetical protein